MSDMSGRSVRNQVLTISCCACQSLCIWSYCTEQYTAVDLVGPTVLNNILLSTWLVLLYWTIYCCRPGLSYCTEQYTAVDLVDPTVMNNILLSTWSILLYWTIYCCRPGRSYCSEQYTAVDLVGPTVLNNILLSTWREAHK